MTQMSETQMSRELSARHTGLLHACNDIERIGDHATNIAEWAIYLASGRHPREIYLQKKQ